MKKRFLSIIVCCVMVVSLFTQSVVSASTSIVASGTCGDNLTWTFYDTGTLKIDGTGAMDDWDSGGPPWYQHRLSITNVVISEGVTTIGSYAFTYCKFITDVSLPQSLKAINKCAFYSCFKLSEITIPNGVEVIQECAFLDCTTLCNINVSNENNYYSSENGAVFSKDKTELVCYPAGKTDNSYIVPVSVTTIKGSAFRSCKNISSVKFSDKLKSVGSFAFYRCDNLTDVYYYGTEGKKEEITLGGYNELSSAIWHYLGFELNKKTVNISVKDTVQLSVNYAAEALQNNNIVWKSSDTSIVTVQNGLVTAVGMGNAVVTATSSDGMTQAACIITVNKAEETITYFFGQSVQIGLIEPWFLKANARVYTEEQPTKIDYTALLDFGAYFIRASELTDKNATQTSLSIEDIVNDSDVVKCSKAQGTASIDGNYITANYNKGLYTYELDDSVFVLFYIEDANGITYAPIRERNLNSLLEARCNDAVNFPNELERKVYQSMLNMFNAISAYRDDYFKTN